MNIGTAIIAAYARILCEAKVAASSLSDAKYSITQMRTWTAQSAEDVDAIITLKSYNVYAHVILVEEITFII